jgi:hypothetical protein
VHPVLRPPLRLRRERVRRWRALLRREFLHTYVRISQ